MNPNARRNVITSMGKVKPSHLLDENLRIACGLDGITGSVVDEDRASLIGESKLEKEEGGVSNGISTVIDGMDNSNGVEVHNPSSFIESLL